jgi:ribosomal protein S18 acetylase RimI-like enzyme
MRVSSELAIRQAAPDEAEIVLDLQRRAYRSEAELYENPLIPPMVQSAEELRVEIQKRTVLVGMLEDRIVASVRGYQVESVAYLGRFIVEPDRQGHGIGTLMIGALEKSFPTADTFELFTGHKSEANLRLYRRLGYVEVKRKQVDAGLSLVFLRKPARAGSVQ